MPSQPVDISGRRSVLRRGCTYGADTPHCVVNTSRPKTALDNLETLAFSENNVILRNANVVECYVTMSVGRIIIAKDTKHTLDGDTGRICWHEDD